ncbi:NAD(P)/FAD-dependent oxidoreductase [Nocardioides zeae]|uniref:NAD(P)/FAD-dependent oxidoreductase n=1 Tax=Nocardioides imazamoxiresistens TaxID=3231893 RepID=A0ABU3Q1G7_9ACTN|nr:NAD(P)/FAD-dependent oxidoreductase [Nocardioides zeae]MDT9595357.1 NAD(P)/FAD-dependent oxidoreductase [Nocardioides zeae]
MSVSMFGPDFPFAFDDWVRHPDGLGTLPEEAHGLEVGVVGAGLAGMVAAYELMDLGLRPVVYEPGQIGGRLRTHRFGGDGPVAEMGGMRFPSSSTTFFHYAERLGLANRPFPNPLTPAAGSTVVDIGGETFYGRTLADLPPEFAEISRAWDAALEEIGFTELQDAIRERDASRLKKLWDELVPVWDGRTFYDFLASSEAFRRLPFRSREIFGLVGFGTGGWDSDFPNSMLEILRVVLTDCDTDQRLVVGGVDQVPRRLWTLPVSPHSPWPTGTTLATLHAGAPRPGVSALARAEDGRRFAVTDRWGTVRHHDAVVATCQTWLLSTKIDTEEALFSQDLWMALDRTRYMQSSKTFVMVDRPFWKDVDPTTGRDVLSMTLTDRLTRGTYLFDNGPDAPGVICLSYSWMSDALKMLPYDVDRRVELCLGALAKIYPDVDVRRHVIGEPVTVSWEDEPDFLGAFKGALPGHYRYNHRMYRHFVQDDLPPAERGIFLAGDDVSFTPAWAEGAVQTALNAVWGVLRHLGGTTSAANPGPGDAFAELGPVDLGD